MKDDISTPTPEAGAAPNAFERDKPGTNARSDAEAAIEELRQRGGVFVNAVRATRMPMVLTDPNLPGNPIVFANESFLKLSGYSMAEVLGQQPHFMNGSGTDPKDAARFAEMLRSEQDEILETVQYRKDGSAFVATVLLSAYKDEDGRTLNHFMSWLDVTRRVEAEAEVAELKSLHAALQASEAKYRSLFDSIDEGFCVIEVMFDADQQPVDYVFLEINPAFERQTGISSAVGRRMREIAPEHEQQWFDIYGRIALTGEAERFEQQAEALGRFYDVYAFRLGDPAQRQVAILFSDIAERKRAETALRESEERQAFLLELGDATRAAATAEAKIEIAARMLGERLNASRVLFTEYDWSRNVAVTFSGWLAEGAEPFATTQKLEEYEGEVLNDLKAGRLVRVNDVAAHIKEPAYAAIANLGVQALLSPPLLVDGKLKFNVSIHQDEPRHWTDDEVALVQEVSERLWAEVVRARAEEALRASEERLRSFGEASQDILWIRDAETVQWIYLTAAFETIYGLSREQAMSGDDFRNWLDLVEPEDRERAQQEVSRVLEGEPNTFEYRIRRPSDGAVRWLRDTDFPIRDASGRVVQIGGVGSDITDRKRAETELRENAEQLRLIVEGARDYAIFTVDRNNVIQTWLPGAANVFGWSKEEAEGQPADITFTPEDRAANEPSKEIETAVREGQAPDVRWHQRKDGRRVFIDGQMIALRNAEGGIDAFLKIGQDVTERRRADEHARTLLAELQHRVRNTLAIVRSIARRTAERSTGLDDMIAHFEGRLNAFSRVQSAVTRNPDSGLDLKSIIEDELVAVAARDGEHLRIDGPAIKLRPRAAESLSLAIHELATNAVKYGALADDSGRVTVLWKRKSLDGTGQLDLEWVESGLSGIATPEREGFGHELLRRSLPYELGAETGIEFRNEGLRFTMSMPLGPDVLAE